MSFVVVTIFTFFSFFTWVVSTLYNFTWLLVQDDWTPHGQLMTGTLLWNAFHCVSGSLLHLLFYHSSLMSNDLFAVTCYLVLLLHFAIYTLTREKKKKLLTRIWNLLVTINHTFNVHLCHSIIEKFTLNLVWVQHCKSSSCFFLLLLK